MTIVTCFALLLVGCSAATSGPPQIVVDRTACSHCGMLISEPLYAAAYQAPGSDARVFDDIGCLRNAARSAAGTLTFWFHDADDREWINGPDAVFVTSTEFRSPMSGGTLAYRSVAGAERAAAKHRGRIVRSVSELLTTEAGS
ncbi:MAG TPA: hypothetical protein VJ813_14315 [Vicinamibacterales bacterium]|nr:hypothetical protein [Vicinamibacterales bacterium]